MNNRYLFRGKRKDNGEWVEGYYACQSNHSCFQSSLKYQHFIYRDICLDFNLGGLEEIEVIPETVGQCTGLKDKNGKWIFEGDVVKLVDATNGIEWNGYIVFGNPYGEYNWGWNIMRISGDSNVNTNILLWVEMEEIGVCCEVIGNIHDNV